MKRMIVEVVGYKPQPYVTIAWKQTGVPIRHMENAPKVLWEDAKGNLYLDSYINILAEAEDSDRPSTVIEKFPEYFV